MRRLARIVLNLTAGGLLVVSAACGVLCFVGARSFSLASESRMVDVRLADRAVSVSWRQALPGWRGWAGQRSGWDVRYTRWSDGSAEVVVPLWLVGRFSLAGGLVVGLMGWQLGRAGRRRAGVCEACGYDLRATPGRCPECGVVVGG